MSQQLYLTQKLLKFRFSNSKPVTTPLAPGIKLSNANYPTNKDERRECTMFPYANAVGFLNWTTICMRLDLSFATSVLNQNMHDPSPAHVRACKHAFQCLRGMLDYHLKYRCNLRSSTPMYGFFDADGASKLDEQRSTSGCYYLLSNCVVNWSSFRQRLIAFSSTKAEYMAMATTAFELV